MAARPELTDVTNSMSAAPEMTMKPDAEPPDGPGPEHPDGGQRGPDRVPGRGGRALDRGDGKERDVRVRLPDALRYNTQAVADLPLIRRGQTQGAGGQAMAARC